MSLKTQSPISSVSDQSVNSEVNNGDGAVVEVVDGETAYFDNLEILKQNAFIEEIKLVNIINKTQINVFYFIPSQSVNNACLRQGIGVLK